jgi:hypothetical protein
VGERERLALGGAFDFVSKGGRNLSVECIRPTPNPGLPSKAGILVDSSGYWALSNLSVGAWRG